jgi:hypothetical protein
MDVKQDQAIKRLLKKLSALRATLKNDERKLLDQLVIGSEDEVEAHSIGWTPIIPNASSGADEVGAHALFNKSNPAGADRSNPSDVNEVGAHALFNKSNPAGADRSNPSDVNEVGAHALFNKSNPAGADRSNPSDVNEVGAHFAKIVFDTDKEEYHIK